MQGMFIANPGDQGHSSVGNGNENAISFHVMHILLINVQMILVLPPPSCDNVY